MVRTPLIAANWKMHTMPEGACAHDSAYQPHAACDVWVFPTFLDIKECASQGLITGGQYGHTREHGAHTGDVSMQLLADAGCRSVLCGHSERRQDHSETNDSVALQAITALECGLHPIICIGETMEEREKGNAEKVVAEQLSHLPLESNIVIAYEPVWAIGSGTPATPDDAEAMHAFIRSKLPEDKRDETRILYGGSMKPDNAKELLSQPNIDGGLVGGASLKPDAFGEIVQIALSLTS